ncbi:hypothetical protein GCM10027047_01560 [Rhodococcus aerolatus]
MSTTRPAGLRARGRALWAELVGDDDVSVARAVLAGEAARQADRLDDLDAVVGHRGRGNRTGTMTAPQAMAESRLCSAQLARLLDQLLVTPAATPAPEPAPEETPTQEVPQVDDIAAARAARRGAAADRAVRPG